MGSPFTDPIRRLASQGVGLGVETLVSGIAGLAVWPTYQVLLRVQADEPIASMLFPVMPTGLDKVRQWFATVEPTQGGGFVQRHALDAPYPVVLEGNFGQRPRVVLGQIHGSALSRLGLVPFEGAALTGYACAQVLEGMCDLAARELVEGTGVPVETWLYCWPIALVAQIVVTRLRIAMRAQEPYLTTYRLDATVIQTADMPATPLFDSVARGELVGAAVGAGMESFLSGLGRI